MKPEFVPMGKEPDKKDSSKNPDKVKEATDERIISDEHLKQAENETNSKLIGHGWQRIEDGLKEIDAGQKQLLEERLQLERDKASLNTERQSIKDDKVLIDGLLAKYNASLDAMNAVIERQEAITAEANEKMRQADIKLAKYDDAVIQKCRDCLARDKRKCEKCHKALYCEKYAKDFQKWDRGYTKKLEGE